MVTLKSEVALGLPESAELQIQSTPGGSQGEMGEKVGFATGFGNNCRHLRGLSVTRTSLNLEAGRMFLMNFICNISQGGHEFLPCSSDL